MILEQDCFSAKKETSFFRTHPSNLWAGIRDDAIRYFEENRISWWMGDSKNEPTGHLLSSQVACINHLYFLRQRKDSATAILQNISGEIREAVKLDKGYVEFEAIGSRNYLGERSHIHGGRIPHP